MALPVRSRSLSLGALVVACAFGPSTVAAQGVRARVVDEAQRAALADVDVALLTTDSTVVARTTTGPDGFFTISASAPGQYLVRVEYLGFEAVTRGVTLGEGQSIVPAFVLRTAAIPLDPLEVEAERGDRGDLRVERSVGRATRVLAAERLAKLEEVGTSFAGAVRDLGGGLRVRNSIVGGPGGPSLPCIESSRGPGSLSSPGSRCRMVAIVINGVDTGLDGEEAQIYVRGLRVADWESIEYLSGVQAGTLYGMHAAERGALVLWARGSGPHRSEARGGGG